MRIAESDDNYDVPLTPLIDVIFLLLFFFLVATNFTRKEIDQQVKLPLVNSGEKNLSGQSSLIINLRDNHTVVVNQRDLPLADLLPLVREWREKFPQGRAVVRGDGAVAYSQVMAVLGICREVGIEQVELPAGVMTHKGQR